MSTRVIVAIIRIIKGSRTTGTTSAAATATAGIAAAAHGTASAIMSNAAAHTIAAAEANGPGVAITRAVVAVTDRNVSADTLVRSTPHRNTCGVDPFSHGIMMAQSRPV